jgi:hypothetical protein
MQQIGYWKRGALAASMSTACAMAGAAPMTLSVAGYYANASLGSNTFANCVAGATQNCAVVTVSAQGDTADLVPFSVPGADGVELFKLSDVTVSIYDPVTLQTLTAKVLPSAGLYFSVDQSNGGIGFGSTLKTPAGVPYGPTYPLSIYATAYYNGGVDLLKTYDLRSSFVSYGFTSFCPTGTACSEGPPLATDLGNFGVTFPVSPSFSRVAVTVTAVPEPATVWLTLCGTALLATVRRARQRRSQH